MNTVFQTFRPSFLVLSPICVFLGFSITLATVPTVNLDLFFLVLAGALSAHISVNTLNEYYDFKSGLDFKTDKTPFSGGSGALPAHPEMAETALRVGLLSLLLTIVLGMFLILERGSEIFLIGFVGVVLVATYTQWLNRYPLLCLIAPGLGFGILMVVGTYVVLVGYNATVPWVISLVPFFLINNLLLLNQYPDVKADALVGRHTFPIAFGFKISNFIYALFSLSAFLLLLVLIVNKEVPGLSLIALIPVIFSMYALSGAIKHGATIGEFPRYLATNVAAATLTPLLLAISITIGR